MTNTLQNHSLVRKILQISMIQLLASFFFLSFAQARDSPPQEILNRRLTLQVSNADLESVLSKIEKATQVQFMYDPRAIQANRKVSSQFQNERLETVLNSVLVPLRVEFQVDGKRIILKKLLSSSSANLKEISSEKVEEALNRNVSGKVASESGEALAGVSILIKGTNSGTTTNSAGEYKISVPDNEVVLIFSSVGFSKQEVAVGSRSVINVAMRSDISSLDEVVVVGYGTQKKVNLTGAVGTINSAFLENRPITSGAQALAGAVSGVFINQNGGQPGSDGASINIRGIGTLNNTNPLVLVDGIEAPINSIDPNDIDNISVLKDAASAAIYGSRASNGVVLITTKRGGRNKKPTISYSFFAGPTQATQLPKLVSNSAQFMELYNEANINSGKTPAFTKSEIDFYRTNGPNTDWISLLFKNGSIQQHNLSISGGSENTNYLVSIGYLDQVGVSQNSNYKRFNARLNLDTKISEKFTIGTSLAVNRGNQKAPLEDIVNGDNTVSGLRATPLYPAFDSQGNLTTSARNFESGFFSPSNPFNEITLSTYQNINNQLLGSAFAEYQLLKDWKVKGTAALNYETNASESFNAQAESYDWISGKPNASLINAGRSRALKNNDRINTTLFLQSTYEKTIGEHHFAILGGFNQESSAYHALGAGRTNFPSNSVQVLGAGDASRSTNYEGKTEWALRSFFGRVNYDYQGRYLVEANVRRDGSSRFGANNRWGIFPSFSAGWVVSNEKFMKQISAIDFLKIRASWGQLGNQYASGTDYPYAAQVAVNNNYVLNGSLVAGAAQTTYDNSNIKWETSTSTNIGLNIGFFKNKLTFDADYFIRETTDILYALPVPATSGGLQNPVVNAASVRNKGWEIAANYRGKTGNFMYGAGFNVTNVSSTVLFINPEASAENDKIYFDYDGKILERGSPINAIYGLTAIGIFANKAEIDGAPKQFGNYGPGDLRYADLNGDKVIDNKDRSVLGHETPTWLYGFNFNLGFKNLSLSAIFQGVGDYQVYSNFELYSPFFNGSGLGAQWVDRWTPEKPTNFPRLFNSVGPNNERTNSFWIQDRSYLRMKNIQLGYDIPVNLIKGIGLKKLRVYANGQNLITVTNFQGLDPERPPGTVRGGYPQVKSVTLGVNVTF